MATIALEGIQFYAYHGFYEEEQVVGAQFTVDVYVEVDISEAAMMDELYTPAEEDSEADSEPLSVNYETLYFLCKQEMQVPSKLLETVAQRISDRIEGYFTHVLGTKVRVKKHHPPLRGKAALAYVEITTGTFAPKMQLPKFKF